MTTAGASFSSGTVLSTYIFELDECDRGLTLGAGIPQHGLSSNQMALVTSDCGTTRSLSIKWP